jgi:hypothetical protein
MHQDFPPRPGGTPIVIGLPDLNLPTATAVTPAGHAPPTSKPAPLQDAVRVALANTYVKALLKGKAYRIQKVALCPSGNGKLVVVGFYATTTVSGTWISVGKPPYHAVYHNVVGLQIYVKATRGVMAIVPRQRLK